MRKIHSIVSAILSPICVAVYITLIFSLFSPIGLGSMNLIQSVLTGFVFLAILPFLIIYSFSKKYGIEIDINDRKKRTPIFLVIILNYIIATLIFWFYQNYIMLLICLSYTIVTSFVMLVNIFWKISVHTAGLTGPLTALIFIFGVSLIPLYILAIPVAYSRYKLDFHNKMQLLVGGLSPIFITYFIYLILW